MHEMLYPVLAVKHSAAAASTCASVSMAHDTLRGLWTSLLNFSWLQVLRACTEGAHWGGGVEVQGLHTSSQSPAPGAGAGGDARGHGLLQRPVQVRLQRLRLAPAYNQHAPILHRWSIESIASQMLSKLAHNLGPFASSSGAGAELIVINAAGSANSRR